MMILRSAPPSPFGRQIRIAAAMLGLSHEIEVAAADTLDPDDTIRMQNPLGKIPALLLEGRAGALRQPRHRRVPGTRAPVGAD